MRDLADRIPWETRAELLAAADTLERCGPAVVAALETLQRATMEAWYAHNVPASLDPAELAEPTDEEWERLERVTGIDRAYRVVGLLSRVEGL